ncbi:nitrate- and nitrite sensing domain-containing protein [Streptomyces sp. NBC_00525]|uniref:nitrate- and nitrite sensing domain-containing protein n=1 Tax=Streptomyces sp. NBC_00525 TaxID=2903660 RepID=UPI002E802A27|nr:nitrate- and nitrite sensing domain-containing protein [Streptomyces sp. NBC_00525]WUC96485.1 nitrate- and nitrite sensing domain-containing protein [Streptomyces sp. NBC_00525]
MSLRTALLVLAVVPGVALAALWAVTSGQTLLDFQKQAAQGQLAQKAGQPSNIVYYNLQEERRLSAEALARGGGPTDALREQRKLTDDAIAGFQSLSDIDTDDAPGEVRDAVRGARTAITQLPAQRTLVDEGDNDQQKAVYRYYTDLIAVDLKLFTALSHVDNGRITTLSQPLVSEFWAKEMISRSDALLARGWASGKLSTADLREVRQSVSAQSFQYSTQVVPFLPDDERAQWEEVFAGSAWETKTRVENQVLRQASPDGDGFVRLGAKEADWRGAMDEVTPQLVKLMELRTDVVVAAGKDSVISLLIKVVLTTVVGLIAVIAVIWFTWRLSRNLRRRISGLQERAEELERALPEVVERLGKGERIDVEAEARAIGSEGDGASDELAQLGNALDLARTSALRAAVEQADQHRGFERLLQRIARRTQQLIGQQLKKLDELERKHEDPEVLDGLFDLDHLTARLRRYEENLVILAGGSPHRRWRKPVALLDVMRSAQGEVQDYRRVVLDLDGSPWLSERAVGPVSHVLAELIENALTFSRPPSPVEVRAAQVSRGLAIEVEDRGLGMEEDRLAAANELMSRPPRMDVLAHADDIRLGLYVIARLADQYGLRVEFRNSAFGGTRVVVLVPDSLTVPGPHAGPVAVPAPAAEDTAPAPEPAPLRDSEALPSRGRGQALAGVTALHAPRAPQETPLPDREEPAHTETHAFGEPEPAQAPYTGADAPYGGTDGQAYGHQDDTYNGAVQNAYADGGQPYMTAEGQYPVAGRTYPDSGEPYGAPQQSYPDTYLSDDLDADGFPVTLPGPPERAAGHPGQPPAGPGPADYSGAGYSGTDFPHADVAGPDAHRVEPVPPAVPGGEPPLPRRVRQASLADELRIAPAAPAVPDRPSSRPDHAAPRPAPHRAGAAIGAFQRRSRAARANEEPSKQPDPSTPLFTGEERT